MNIIDFAYIALAIAAVFWGFRSGLLGFFLELAALLVAYQNSWRLYDLINQQISHFFELSPQAYRWVVIVVSFILVYGAFRLLSQWLVRLLGIKSGVLGLANRLLGAAASFYIMLMLLGKLAAWSEHYIPLEHPTREEQMRGKKPDPRLESKLYSWVKDYSTRAYCFDSIQIALPKEDK